MQLDFDLRPTTTVNILETYSPFPSFGQTRDPFGLDTFLLHPADVPWEYLRSSPSPGDALLVQGDKPKKADGLNRMSMLRRPSPLASNPPLSAGIEEAAEEDERDDDAEHTSGNSTPESSPPRRPSSTLVGGKALRALISGNRKNPLLTPESDSPDTMPSTPEEETMPSDAALHPPPDRRSMYSLSGSSSEDSCDGLLTPHAESSPTDVTARLTAALQEDQQRQEDQQQRKSNRTSWRDWLGGRRTSFLGIRGGDSGTTLLESPRASVVDLIPEEDVTVPAIADSDLARSAVQLRRLSLIKLGSLRMPSPHPLAPVLARQSANLPNEVAFAIPTSRRVYPKSVNSVRKSEPLPAQAGLRIALGLRNIIQRIDAGERPTELLSVARKTNSRQSMRRARGMRDFVDRRPFEERNVVYYPNDWVEEVSMARSGYGVWDLDFSPYILAMAETEEKPPRNYAMRPRPSSQPSDALPPAPVAKVTKVESARQSLKPVFKSPAPALAPSPAPAPAQAVAQAVALAPKPVPQSRASMPPSLSSFRARPKPSTWDDSSDEEGHSDSAIVRAQAPVRPPTTRNQTAPAASAPAQRQSRLIDPNAALEHVTASRDRRHEQNMNHVQRKAVTDQRRVSTMMLEEKEKNRRGSYAKSLHEMRRPQPSNRLSSMTLSADAQAASLNKRASSQTLSAMATSQSRTSITTTSTKPTHDTLSKSRPAASLPSSPRLQSSDRRRVVSQYEPPVMNSRMSMMNLNMYGHPVVPMPAVPTVAAPYVTPMMTGMSMMHPRASMMFNSAAPMAPMAPVAHHYAPYAPQFAHGGAPQMFLQPPPPNTGRRRERPVA